MNEMLVPLFPSFLWLAACAVAILLLLVLLGYHLYQRNRVKALLGDSESIGDLAAKKEILQSDLRELRGAVATQKQELLQLEAERRKQELFRVDLASLERSLEDRRQESAKQLDNLAHLDNQLSRRKQALGRLDAEIAALEKRRQEMAPLEESLQDLRVELDRGNIKLAQLAEQELKVGALMHQARDLAREIEDLTHTLEPMRHEKNRLRLFVEQARHSSAVKNEQILDQKRQLISLGERKKDLMGEIAQLERQLTALESLHAEKKEAVEEAQNQLAAFVEEKNVKTAQLNEHLDKMRQQALSELDQESGARQRKLDELLAQIQLAQMQLEQTLLRKDERVGEVAALAGRAAVLQREIEKMTSVAAAPKEKAARVARCQKKIMRGKHMENALHARAVRNIQVFWPQ